ncbi:Iron-uptake system permease protein FeuC [compost metagenome]
MSQFLTSPAGKQRRSRDITIISLLAILIIIMFVVSMNTGLMHLSPLDVLHTLLGDGTQQQKLILFDFRLPRIVISLLVGAGFAVIIFISFVPATTAAHIFVLPLMALVGAVLTAALIYLFLRLDPQNFQFVSIWLAGKIWGGDWRFVLALLPWIVILLSFSF